MRHIKEGYPFLPLFPFWGLTKGQHYDSIKNIGGVMNRERIDIALEPFLKDQIEANNWYEAKAIEVLTEELQQYLLEFDMFNIAFHYHVTMDGWTHYRTYSDCQKSAIELIEMLIELHIKHGNHWAFYIEDDLGNPRYFIEYNGYEFYYDEIMDY